MSDLLLSLIPLYGLWIVALVAMLACLAIPVPASVVVMAAGGFSAAGDLDFTQLVVAAAAGYLIGDQILFNVARFGGPPLLDYIRKHPRAPVSTLESAESLIKRRGIVAVFLSRTVLSPLGATVGLLSGALGLGWAKFSVAAVPAGLLWAFAYSSLGYAFAGRIAELASLIGGGIGVVLTGTTVVVLVAWLIRSARINPSK